MRWLLIAVLLVGVIAGCSGDDEDDPGPVTSDTRDATATSTDGSAQSEATEAEPTEAVEEEAEPTATSEPEATATTEATATPEATSIPEPTATATEEPATALVEVEQYITREASYGGTVYVEGIVINNGAAPASDINVAVSLYDAAGTILQSTRASSVLPFIAPGGKSPFRAVALDLAADQVAETRIQVQAATYDSTGFMADFYSTSVTVNQVQWTADTIAGEVQNAHDGPLTGVTIIVVGYDASGAVIGVEQTYASLDVLDPGMTSGFSTSPIGYAAAPVTVEAYAFGRTP